MMELLLRLLIFLLLLHSTASDGNDDDGGHQCTLSHVHTQHVTLLSNEQNITHIHRFSAHHYTVLMQNSTTILARIRRYPPATNNAIGSRANRLRYLAPMLQCHDRETLPVCEYHTPSPLYELPTCFDMAVIPSSNGDDGLPNTASETRFHIMFDLFDLPTGRIHWLHPAPTTTTALKQSLFHIIVFVNHHHHHHHHRYQHHQHSCRLTMALVGDNAVCESTTKTTDTSFEWQPLPPPPSQNTTTKDDADTEQQQPPPPPPPVDGTATEEASVDELVRTIVKTATLDEGHRVRIDRQQYQKLLPLFGRVYPQLHQSSSMFMPPPPPSTTPSASFRHHDESLMRDPHTSASRRVYLLAEAGLHAHHLYHPHHITNQSSSFDGRPSSSSTRRPHLLHRRHASQQRRFGGVRALSFVEEGRQVMMSLWRTHDNMVSLLEAGMATRQIFGLVIDPVLNFVPWRVIEMMEELTKDAIGQGIGNYLAAALVKPLVDQMLEKVKHLVETDVWNFAKDRDLNVVYRDTHQQLMDDLPMLVETEIQRTTSRELIRGITEDLSASVSAAIIHQLFKEIVAPITSLCTKMITAPVAHTVAATITQALQRRPRSDVICIAKCVGEQELPSCVYCHTADNYHYDFWASYYVQYYDRFYTNAYAGYYSEVFTHLPPIGSQAAMDTWYD